MKDFILPDIGEGIVECELVKWLIKEGDVIEEDQAVAEVMTDKALVEIPAPHAGTVVRLYCREGETALVHAPLFAVDEAGEADGKEAPGSDRAASTAKAQGTGSVDEAAGEPVDERRSRDFILPDIGEGIVECEVVTWHVAEGDKVKEDQTIVDVMTDKALVEITASEHGRIMRFYYAQGESARVHTPLYAYVPDSGGAADEASRVAHEAVMETGAPPAAQRGSSTCASGVSPVQACIPATPAVRRLLREHALNINAIAGSGRNGRVLKEDVLAYLARDPEAAVTTGHPPASCADQHHRVVDHAASAPLDEPVACESHEPRASRLEARQAPLKGVAAVMARRMVQSSTQIPHFHYGDELDVTELLALRARLKSRADKEGARLTLMPFIMKAMALAVLEEPILNASLSDDESQVLYHASCNIGMAVDGAAGLMVPNVKGVERLSILEIAHEVARLTEAARNGRVPQADLKGGTLSISNIGALGGTYAAPIINQPEVAIVALGRTQRLPRFDVDGNVCARDIMTITWAGDHRIIDGGTIARFSNLWKHYLEHPDEMLLSLA